MAEQTTTAAGATRPAKVNQYEGMFLLGQAATQDQPAALNLVRGMIERHAGQILVIKRWDERKLAYEIGKQKRGTYVIAFFKASGDNVTTLEREAVLSGRIFGTFGFVLGKEFSGTSVLGIMSFSGMTFGGFWRICCTSGPIGGM